MKSIRVAVLVLPDGKTVWLKDNEHIDGNIRTVFANWKKSLLDETRQKYEKENCTTGVVTIYMLPEDYYSIKTTNESAEIFEGVLQE